MTFRIGSKTWFGCQKVVTSSPKLVHFYKNHLYRKVKSIISIAVLILIHDLFLHNNKADHKKSESFYSVNLDQTKDDLGDEACPFFAFVNALLTKTGCPWMPKDQFKLRKMP